MTTASQYLLSHVGRSVRRGTGQVSTVNVPEQRRDVTINRPQQQSNVARSEFSPEQTVTTETTPGITTTTTVTNSPGASTTTTSKEDKSMNVTMTLRIQGGLGASS